MAEITTDIGGTICLVLAGLVHQCRTGESVATVGYCAVALILLVGVVSAFVKRIA
jgi:hypothetical protein